MSPGSQRVHLRPPVRCSCRPGRCRFRRWGRGPNRWTNHPEYKPGCLFHIWWCNFSTGLRPPVRCSCRPGRCMFRFPAWEQCIRSICLFCRSLCLDRRRWSSCDEVRRPPCRCSRRRCCCKLRAVVCVSRYIGSTFQWCIPEFLTRKRLDMIPRSHRPSHRNRCLCCRKLPWMRLCRSDRELVAKRRDCWPGSTSLCRLPPPYFEVGLR